MLENGECACKEFVYVLELIYSDCQVAGRGVALGVGLAREVVRVES